eukprot:g24345.t1
MQRGPSTACSIPVLGVETSLVRNTFSKRCRRGACRRTPSATIAPSARARRPTMPGPNKSDAMKPPPWRAVLGNPFIRHPCLERTARELLHQMPRALVDLVSFNSALYASIRAGELHSAEELWWELKTQHLRPDVMTYSSMISGYAKVRGCDRAEELWRSMRESRVRPNVVTYNALLDARVNDQLAQAEELLGEMKQEEAETSGRTLAASAEGRIGEEDRHPARKADARSQVVVIGWLAFCGPGLFNALNGLGNAGSDDADVAALANGCLYCTFALCGYFGSVAFNLLGPTRR